MYDYIYTVVRMKKAVLQSVTLTLFLASLSFFSCQKNKEKDDLMLQKYQTSADKAIQRLDTLLDLTEAQITALRPFALESASELTEFKNNSKDYSLKQKSVEVKRITDKFESALKDVLTADQYIVYTDYKATQNEKKVKLLQDKFKERSQQRK